MLTIFSAMELSQNQQIEWKTKEEKSNETKN